MYTETYAIFDKIRDQIDSLSKKIKGNIFGFYTKLSSKKIRDIEETQNVTFPTVIKKLYAKVCNGIFMEWKIPSNSDNRIIEGKTEIFSLERLYSEYSYYYIGRKELKETFWLESSKNDLKNEQFYVLDHCDHGNYTIFKIEKNTPVLYWYNAYGQLKKLTLTFDEYINHTVKFGGILLWQEYFVENFHESPILTIKDSIDEEIQKINPNIPKNSFTINQEIIVDSEFHSYINSKSKSKFNYYSYINEALKELKKNKKFKKVKYTINPGVSIASLRRFHASQHMELPQELIEFYYQVNGFSLKWETQHEEKIYHGAIRIQSLEDVMGGKEIKEWNRDVYKNQYWFDENDSELHKSFKRFENIEGESADIVISFSEKSYELYYINAGEPVKLKMNIQEYIETILSTMGIDGWHMHYIPKSETEGLEFISESEIKAIFPNYKK